MFGQNQNDEQGDNGSGFVSSGDDLHGAPNLTPSAPVTPPDSSALNDASAPALQPGENIDPTVAPVNTSDVPDFGQPFPAAPATSSSFEDVTPTQSTQSNPSSDDLIGIKQEALEHLSPLVEHLDQTPEEKFKTTMMMIQASDDQSLIKSAFETAQKITDDKVRAQAFLDIINEINYFTQQHNQ